MGTAVTSPDGIASGGRRGGVHTPGALPALPRTPRASGPQPALTATAPVAYGDLHEASLAKAMIAVFGLVACAVVGLSGTLGREATLAFLMLTLFGALWYAIVLIVARNARNARTRRHLVLLTGASAVIEGLAGSITLALVAHFLGGEAASSSGSLLAYALFGLVTASRLRPGLSAAVAILGVASHALVWGALVSPDAAARVGALPTWMLAERSLWLALIGAMAVFVTHRGRTQLIARRLGDDERRLLERELSRFVSPDVAHAILRGEAVVGQAERRDVTVLFCDLRDFTGMCERQPPEEVVAMLNAFYARAVHVIAAHGGTVNKFLGDGLLAIFGAPDEHPAHPHGAAEAAHDLLAAADELRAQGGVWRRFDVGIGLDTGDVVAGAVGSPARAEYTVIGSTVNRAARLQALSRRAGHRIVMSAATVERLGPRANVVSLGEVALKGFTAAENVYSFRHA